MSANKICAWFYVACAIATTGLAIMNPNPLFIVQSPVIILLAWMRFTRARWELEK